MAEEKIILEENTELIQPPYPLKTPFGDTQASPAIVISSTPSVSEPSVPLGFPAAYSKPTEGGKYIPRGEMNAMLNLATTNQVRAQQGGINTFNTNLVSITGGYSRGAVLDWWDDRTNVLRSVISLRDANSVDFTAVGADGYSKGPDGVYWKQCSRPASCFSKFEIGEATIIGKFSNLTLPTSYGWISGVITMPFDGYVVCQDSTQHATTSVQIPFVEELKWYTHIKALTTDPQYTGTIDCSLYEAIVEKPEVVSEQSFNNQKHEIFVAVCHEDDVEPSVDMENIGSGGSNCAICMVSSSGQDGGGAPGPILVKKGNLLRLFGRQGYTESSGIEDIPSTYVYKVGNINPSIVREGGLITSIRLVAYPVY